MHCALQCWHWSIGHLLSGGCVLKEGQYLRRTHAWLCNRGTGHPFFFSSFNLELLFIAS